MLIRDDEGKRGRQIFKYIKYRIHVVVKKKLLKVLVDECSVEAVTVTTDFSNFFHIRQFIH